MLPPVSPPTRARIDVKADYAGDLPRALAHATALPAATAKTVDLGEGVYSLSSGIVVPVNTTITGAGPDATRLVFSIRPPSAPKDCGAPVQADF